MQETITNNELEKAVLDTLRYFHIFRHPLYIADIYSFLHKKVEKDLLQQQLDNMIAEGKIFVHDEMYMLEDNPSFSVKRQRGADMAQKLMGSAIKSAGIVGSFPFVKAVCISGSLSKGYADERSDIDYFIITGKNRLWICRSLLHLYKKFTFLTGRQHSFCMNYFLDEGHLQLEEQNVFTATEMVTLHVVYGEPLYKSFISKNEIWLHNQFPNRGSICKEGSTVTERYPLFKKCTTAILDMLAPASMNKFFMQLTDMWWRYKWKRKNYPMEDYDLAMKTKIYVSKNHPANYQKKVLKGVHNNAPTIQQALQTT